MSETKKKRIDWDLVKQRLRATEIALEQSSIVEDQRLNDIFRQRAERLAKRVARRASDTETTATLTFKMGDETYGIRLQDVAQVFPDTESTPVPGAAAELVGVANLRGEVRSVLDLRLLLGLPANDADTNQYILLLRHDGLKVGLRVEQIEDVRQVAHDLATATDDVSDQSARYVHGLTRDNLILLRTDAFFEHFRSRGIGN